MFYKSIPLIIACCWQTTLLAENSKNQEGFNRLQEKQWELFHGQNPHPPIETKTEPKATSSGETTETKQYYGVVKELKPSAGYMYIKLTMNDRDIWAASGVADIKVGDKIRLDEAYPMHGFYAKSLDKTFDVILFASGVTKAP